MRATGVDLQLSDVTSDAVAEICRRLDGLPLALELAAAWAPLLPPVALLERLEPRLPLLAGGPSDLPARQRTMFDAIDWSYGLLDPAEQRLFRRMTVFAGGCSLDAAVSVCADDNEHAVLTRLAALLDKNLLRREETGVGTSPPRMFMLETIREYGLERLEESGEALALRARHAKFFLDLAEEAAPAMGGPDQLVWTVRLELDRDNFRSALAWLCDQAGSDSGLRLVAALWRFWSARGYGREAQGWLDRVLSLPVNGAAVSSNAIARVRAQMGAAVLALEHGALDDAEAKISECLPLARQCGDRNVLVDTLNAAGLIARTRSEYVAAANLLEEALDVSLTTGYRSGEATALAERALTTFLTGDASCAVEILEQAIATYRELGDTRGLAAGLRDLGWMIWHAGDAVRGEELREEALAQFRTLGDVGQVAETIWGMGISAQYRGDHERATEFYRESLALRRSRGDDRGAAQVLSTLAQVALHQRELPTARTMFSEALDIVRRLGDRWGQAMILALQGHLELVSGRREIARDCFSVAAALYAEIGNLLYLPWCIEGFAGIAVVENAVDDAAFLLGAREVMLDIVGRGLPPADPPGLMMVQELVRAAIGDFALSDAYRMGQSLSQDDVVALTTRASLRPLKAQPSD